MTRTAAPAGRSPSTMGALRRDLERLGFEVADEDYRNAVGLRSKVETASIFARYAHVSSPSSLELVREAAGRARGRSLRRLRFLEADLLGSVLADRFAAEEDRLATAETRAVVRVGRERIPYRSIGQRIENEDDRARRRRMVRARDGVKRRFLPRVEALERAYRTAYRELGYPDDAARWERVHGESLARVEARTRPLLADASFYARLLDRRLRESEGIGLREAEGHDVAHALRAKRFDRHFPKSALLAAFLRFLKGLGFDVARMRNVTLDLADRPRKEPRPFVLPARVPQDVRLVTKPAGGMDDHRALFHEGGHLLHFATTRADLPYEDRYFGDDGVTESYAYLFEHLFENPMFLAEHAPTLGDEARADMLRLLALDKLLGLRYYAACLPYDRWLARADLADAPARYERHMTRAMKVKASRLDYLATDGFYGVSYLNAWMLEAAHRRFLEDAFGESWWREKAAGRHLRKLFARGTAPTSAEIAREIGGRLDARAVMAGVRRLAGEG